MKKKSLIPEKARIVGGSGAGHRKIYISREVYKNIFNFSKDKNVVQCGGVLLGQFVAERDGDYVIIRAFVEGKYSEGTSNSITFTKDTWNYIDNKKEEYPEYDIVGWMHTNPDTGRRASDYDEFFHSHMFDNRDIVAYIVDPVQIAEAFYYWENGHLVRSDGFYIFSETVMPKIIPERKSRVARSHGDLEELQIVDDPSIKSAIGKERAVSSASMFETATLVEDNSEKKYETKSLEIDPDELRKVFEEAEKKVEEDNSDIEAYAFSQVMEEEVPSMKVAKEVAKPFKKSKKSEKDEYLIMDENDRIAIELEEAEEEKPKKLSRKEKKALQKAKKAEKLEKTKANSQAPVRNIDAESVRDRVSKLAGEKITVSEESIDSVKEASVPDISAEVAEETVVMGKAEEMAQEAATLVNNEKVVGESAALDKTEELVKEVAVLENAVTEKKQANKTDEVVSDNADIIDAKDALAEESTVLDTTEISEVVTNPSETVENRDVLIEDTSSNKTIETKKSKLPTVIAILAVVIIAMSAVVGFSFKKIIDLEKEITRLYNNDEIIAKYINSGVVEETGAETSVTTEGETVAETGAETATKEGGEGATEATSEDSSETAAAENTGETTTEGNTVEGETTTAAE